MRILSKSVQLRLALLRALALVFAQLGAQLHAYSHLTAAAHPHAASHATDQLYDGGGSCSDCLFFAPLLAAAFRCRAPVESVSAPAAVARTGRHT